MRCSHPVTRHAHRAASFRVDVVRGKEVSYVPAMHPGTAAHDADGRAHLGLGIGLERDLM